MAEAGEDQLALSPCREHHKGLVVTEPCGCTVLVFIFFKKVQHNWHCPRLSEPSAFQTCTDLFPIGDRRAAVFRIASLDFGELTQQNKRKDSLTKSFFSKVDINDEKHEPSCAFFLSSNQCIYPTCEIKKHYFYSHNIRTNICVSDWYLFHKRRNRWK